MIRKLLATTAFATLVAAGAFAQETTTAAPVAPEAAPAQTDATQTQTDQAQGSQMQMNGFLASNLIGETVYSTPAAEASQEMQEEQGDEQAAQEGDDANQQAAQNGAAQQDAGAQAEANAEALQQQQQAAESNVQTQTDANGQTAQNDVAAGQQNQQIGDNIGEINDLVIGQSGQVEAIVVGVGGFLGIGEKDVALPFNEIQFMQGGNGQPQMMVNATRESLEALPNFDRSMYDGSAANMAQNDAAGTATGTTNGGMAPAAGGATVTQDAQNTNQQATGETAANTTTTTTTTTQNNAGGTDQTQTGAIDRSQLQEIPQDQLTAETLVGTSVYGANDENIGEIGDIVLTQDGQVDAVLVDVGGFLGIGEKRVAIGMDKLQFLQDGNGNRYLYTNFSQEQLNAQAAYEEGSYSQNRDQQRLIVQ